MIRVVGPWISCCSCWALDPFCCCTRQGPIRLSSACGTSIYCTLHKISILWIFAPLCEIDRTGRCVRIFVICVRQHFLVFEKVRNRRCTVVNKRPLAELCAPLAVRIIISNSCTRWREIFFKELSQDGERADFSKNLRASLFNKSNEPNFSQTHLAGQNL